MNHNTSKPFIPSPPALPRFDLPSEGSEGGVDPLDVAVTTQRPALDGARALRVLRPGARTKPKADATSEVQVEDILLEVYAEEPPPPTRRSVGAPALPPRVSIAAAIASAVPPAPAESAAVDALLRASDPAFLPFGGAVQHQAPRPQTPAAFAPSAPFALPYHQAYAYSAADQESPSVAPVAFPSAHMMAASHVTAAPPSAFYPDVAPPAQARAGRGASFAIWTVVLLAVGLGSGAGVAVGLRNGTFAALRDRARTLTTRGESKAAAAAPAAPPATVTPAAPVVAPAPVVVPALPAAAPTPTVSVNSLPAQVIPDDSSLVTFPASAQGHRVFFDGRPMAVTLAPVKLRCGRHMIRIGSSGKPRVTDLACGQSVTLLR